MGSGAFLIALGDSCDCVPLTEEKLVTETESSSLFFSFAELEGDDEVGVFFFGAIKWYLRRIRKQ